MGLQKLFRKGLPRYNLLVRAKRRVAGWVAGGCWDDEITVMTGIIPENSLRLAPGK